MPTPFIVGFLLQGDGSEAPPLTRVPRALGSAQPCLNSRVVRVRRKPRAGTGLTARFTGEPTAQEGWKHQARTTQSPSATATRPEAGERDWNRSAMPRDQTFAESMTDSVPQPRRRGLRRPLQPQGCHRRSCILLVHQPWRHGADTPGVRRDQRAFSRAVPVHRGSGTATADQGRLESQSRTSRCRRG